MFKKKSQKERKKEHREWLKIKTKEFLRNKGKITKVTNRGYMYTEDEGIKKWDHRERLKKSKDYPRYYEVHHIDRCPWNNKEDNLIALPKGFHKWIHESYEVCDYDEIAAILTSYLKKEFNHKKCSFRTMLIKVRGYDREEYYRKLQAELDARYEEAKEEDN